MRFLYVFLILSLPVWVSAADSTAQADAFKFRSLSQAYEKYSHLERIGAWDVIPDGPTLHQGDVHPLVCGIRLRLAKEDPHCLPATSSPELFDDELALAVRRFQTQHGLKSDAVVGSKTRAAMNVSAGDRARQIAVNIKRHSGTEIASQDLFIRVNIPAFQLDVIHQGKNVLNMRVIVGRQDRPTPMLTSEVTYLEINPTWNIPQKLLRRDILPRILQDPKYLEKMKIRVFETWHPGASELDPANVAWDSIPSWDMAFKLQQQPGPANPLGQVKFMFVNPYSVYLHDTPAKGNFEKSRRCFSSGCVRLEDPIALADLLMERNGESPSDSLQESVTSGHNQKFSLPRSVPVYLIYETAWVDDLGVCQFREDVYGHDEPLKIALEVGAISTILGRCKTLVSLPYL